MADLFGFDLSALGVFALTVLIPGIVQSAKEHFGVKGKGAFLLSAILGIVFVGLGEAINQGVVPAPWKPWITIVVIGLAGGLAAAGYYDLLLKPIKAKLDGA